MGWEYFFRTVQDQRAPHVPLVLIILFIAGLVWCARNRKQPELYALTAIFLQVMILVWYRHAGTLFGDGLPLYHCRISLWFISLGLLWRRKGRFLIWLSLLGLPTSLLVLLMRDMSPFTFPHVTNFYYFLGHGIIFLVAVHYLAFDRRRLQLKEIVTYTLILHSVVYGLNVYLGTNYSYLRRLPLVQSEVVNRFSFLVMTLVIVAIVAMTQSLLERTKMRAFLRLQSEATELAFSAKVNKAGI